MARTQLQAPRYPSIEALLAAGADVQAVDYARGSTKKQVRSVKGQHRDHEERIAAHGWTWAASYEDDGISGSEGEDAREGLCKLREHIRTQRPDVLVVWAINREARDMEHFVGLRNLCIKHGVCYWLAGTSLYDLRRKDDRLNLGIQAVLAENFRDGLIEATVRGFRDSAEDGLPAPGPCPFGFRRLYDKHNGRPVGQEPDDEIPAWLVGDDRWTPKQIVEEVYRQAAAGESIRRIVAYLNERQIPNPRTFRALQAGRVPAWRSDGKPELRSRRQKAGALWDSRWNHNAVRFMLMNPVYKGWRRHHEQIVRRACSWTGFIDAAKFDDVDELLSQPGRAGNGGNTQATYYLSRMARCTSCAQTLGPRTKGSRGAARGATPTGPIYRCDAGCVSIVMSKLDQYVIDAVLFWLSHKSRTSALAAIDGDDPDLVAATNELAALVDEERDWHAAGKAGEFKGRGQIEVYLSNAERLAGAVAQAEAKVRRLRGYPPHVRALIGANAARLWKALDITAQRRVLRSLVEVNVKPAGGRKAAAEQRVELRWLLGA